MLVRVVLLLAILAFPASAFALKGRVVDQQGRPVAGATVSVLGRPGEAITDAEGRFEWQPDPTPPFELLVIDASGTYGQKGVHVLQLTPKAPSTQYKHLFLVIDDEGVGQLLAKSRVGHQVFTTPRDCPFR